MELLWLAQLSLVLIFSTNQSVQQMIIIQSLLPAEEQSIAMAVFIFCQNFGGSLFFAFAQTIFDNRLQKLLAEYIPGVDVKAVIAAGATGWKGILSESQIPGVLKAYAGSIDAAFWLALGTSVGIIVFSFCMGWVDIRKKEHVEPSIIDGSTVASV